MDSSDHWKFSTNRLKIATVAKPPWSYKSHNGKLERIILSLGSGKGKFSEIYGIPRSLGCIGNNRFILRDEKIGIEEIERVVKEFTRLGGREIYLVNYDEVEELIEISRHISASFPGDVFATIRIEDINALDPVEGLKVIVEMEYSEDALSELEHLKWAHGALIMARYKEYTELLQQKVEFPGEVYVDILFPGSLKNVEFNLFEVKKLLPSSPNKYHSCLAGTIAIAADGYITPCPLLRNFVVGNIRKDKLWYLPRRKVLNQFWTLTKDNITLCRSCPFKYTCHDCRALEYQASGDIHGIEYCEFLGIRVNQNPE
ncbi:SPASM domain-containing protein [Thermococcus litoralis]|uniref:SPASM domain-containing protein n=1 Tax=Thermococcus litoralis TaxID=2265 RepID=UPI000B35FB11|nr:SPASM domain-containing protein [Thermococcus litoralis]